MTTRSLRPSVHEFAIACCGAAGASTVFGKWLFVAFYWCLFLICVAVIARRGTSS
jgi:hypothetical protein